MLTPGSCDADAGTMMSNDQKSHVAPHLGKISTGLMDLFSMEFKKAVNIASTSNYLALPNMAIIVLGNQH